MGELWRRLWFLLNRARFERELREEIDGHRAMKGPAEVPFGNALRLRDEAIDAWGWRWLERAFQDLRFAARLLWRSPAFTVTAIAVLALGVGVNLAAYRLFDRLVLSPRPVRDAETLVNLHRRTPQSTTTTFSYPAFAFYREHATRLTSAMALQHTDVTIGDDRRRHHPAVFVTGNYFSEMGGTPLAGRLLGQADDRADAAPVVVLAETLWRNHFGGDPAVVGRELRINGSPFLVAGIVPSAFAGLHDRGALWMPITQHRAAIPGSTLLEDWSGGTIDFYGRVPSEATWSAVEAELRGLTDALRQQQPTHVWKDEWLELRDAGHLMPLDEAAPAFALIAALVGLVLIGACVNLGLLVLARTLARGREFSIRLSVGATRARIVRQLLTEQLLLGLLGAAGGCLVAVQASAIVRRVTGTTPGLDAPFDVGTLVVAAMLAVLSATLVGVAPVWQTMRPALTRRFRLHGVLLSLQVMTAAALLVLSGLLVRGVTRTALVSPGFDYLQTIAADPDLLSHGVSPEAAADYWRRVLARLRDAPGIRAAALSTLPPLGNRVNINGERTVFYGVTPSYFEALGIPIVRGRAFGAGEPEVVIVSHSLAARRWPGQDPLGQVYDGDTVIGVAGDARTVKLNDSGATECYRPITPRDMPLAVLVARVDGAPGAASDTVRQVMTGEDTRLQPEVTPLEEALGAKVAGSRQAAQLVSMLGACALLLAVTGLGGLVAFTVSQRAKEIGIRVALGARSPEIVRAVLRQFTVPVLTGCVAGSAVAALGGLILSRELYGVSAADPLAHLGAFTLFGSTAVLAALPSLRRAVRVDPVQALRHD